MSSHSDDCDIDRIFRIVRDHSGLEFPPGRRTTARRPIREAMNRLGVASIGELADRLTAPAGARERQRLVVDLTVGETHFFRNAAQTDAMERLVLPDLIKRRRDTRRLVIWSAGCSTGEEPYSIAMSLDRLLLDREGWDITIAGTDINDVALERARAGRYGEWSFRGVPDDVRRRYFTQLDPRTYELSHSIRESVHFDNLNLVTDSVPAPGSGLVDVDLIVCRNVLIYFSHDTAAAVVRRLESSLASDGWLVAGHAESPMPVFREVFDAQPVPGGVVFRKRSSMAPDRPAGQAPAVTAPATRTAPIEPRAVEPAPPVASDAQPIEPVTDDAPYRWDPTGDPRDALAVLHRHADDQPTDPEPLIMAARLLAGSGEFDAADHVIRMAIERDSVNAIAHQVHSVILQSLGRPRDAMDALRRSAYLDPDDPLVQYLLASLLDEQGDSARAHAALTTALELLDGQDDMTIVDEYDGVTVAELRELTRSRYQLLTAGLSA